MVRMTCVGGKEVGKKMSRERVREREGWEKVNGETGRGKGGREGDKEE